MKKRQLKNDIEFLSEYINTLECEVEEINAMNDKQAAFIKKQIEEIAMLNKQLLQ